MHDQIVKNKVKLDWHQIVKIARDAAAGKFSDFTHAPVADNNSSCRRLSLALRAIYSPRHCSAQCVIRRSVECDGLRLLSLAYFVTGHGGTQDSLSIRAHQMDAPRGTASATLLLQVWRVFVWYILVGIGTLWQPLIRSCHLHSY